MKKLAFIKRSNGSHWVGDGFPVKNIFSYSDIAEEMSPFLLMDYAGPADFPPTTRQLGVGQHPHRGFETVTIVYAGGVAHRDSSGGGGTIGPGDVQWMTAASGLIHEEFHSPAFAAQGGRFEMVQLWVNLPAKHKMSTPGYQGITSDTIPQLSLKEGDVRVRIIAGNDAGLQQGEVEGPARTFSPMNIWDLRLKGGASVVLPAVAGWNSALVVLKGSLIINGQERAGEAQLVLLDPNGEEFMLEAEGEASLLLLSGEPIDEPIVGYGPFVMNSEAEIHQAIDDFNSGRFAVIAP